MTEKSSHPYSGYEGTPTWSVIDRALQDLVGNRDLVETTAHEYIVGYLCKVLAEPRPLPNEVMSSSSRQAALQRVRMAVRAANPENRDLVGELIAERRLEASYE